MSKKISINLHPGAIQHHRQKELGMISKKSPCGATFPYYYKNGELFGAHYESFGRGEQALLDLIRAEEEFIVAQHYPLPYWVNFYGTKLTDALMREFLQSMNRMQRYVPKLAVVGCSVMDQWRMKRVGKEMGLTIPVRYFRDPEVAKAWLVNEF